MQNTGGKIKETKLWTKVECAIINCQIEDKHKHKIVEDNSPSSYVLFHGATIPRQFHPNL